MATHWLLPGKKERDLIATHHQAPTSAPEKYPPSLANLARRLCLFPGPLKICGFVGRPVAFVGRKGSCV